MAKANITRAFYILNNCPECLRLAPVPLKNVGLSLGSKLDHQVPLG